MWYFTRYCFGDPLGELSPWIKDKFLYKEFWTIHFVKKWVICIYCDSLTYLIVGKSIGRGNKFIDIFIETFKLPGSIDYKISLPILSYAYISKDMVQCIVSGWRGVWSASSDGPECSNGAAVCGQYGVRLLPARLPVHCKVSIITNQENGSYHHGYQYIVRSVS